MPRAEFVTWGLVAGFVALALASGIRPLRGDIARPALAVGALTLWWADGAFGADFRGEYLLVGVVVCLVAPSLPSVWMRVVAVAGGIVAMAQVLPAWWPRRWEVGLGTALVMVPVATAASARRYGQTLTTVLLAVTAFGIYAGPPDTEATTILTAMFVVCAAWLLWCGGLRDLAANPTAMAGVAALVVVTAMWASRGRIAAFPGATACFGILLVQPLADLVTRRTLLPEAQRLTLSGAAARLVIHVGAVGVASRVAALRTDVTQSVVISSVALGAATAALVAVQFYEDRRRAPVSLS